MKRRSRTVAAGVLVALAGALVYGVVLAKSWGGHMKVALILFGDWVWLTVDAGNSRILFLLVAPAVLLLAALSLRARRPGE